MKLKKRIVRAHKDDSDTIVFELLEGTNKMLVRQRFGYATNSGIWVSIEKLRNYTVSITVESPALVKEQIARWRHG